MTSNTIQDFIDRWQQADGAERANYQIFLTELCELLDLPRPEPASQDTAENAYVFERKVTFRDAGGDERPNFIDLYKRDCFVLEAKQTGMVLESQSWDTAMRRAHNQAQGYARSLPPSERPPFIIVTDVGRSIELYSEFSRTGGNYVPFPDPRSFRIRLEDLATAETRELLRSVWTDAASLDPASRSARVTKAIASDLAKLAEGLESAGHAPDAVASFLMRCLFTMFAEDVGLLPERSFTQLLEETRAQPELFPRLVPGLWKAMNEGGFSAEIRNDVLRFNGGLFAEQWALVLDRQQVDLLIAAARADWRDVEPAIFGTLLERALDPVERHKLGAHYTPRAYVERLVMPTVIEPLRSEWETAQAVALGYDQKGERKKAVKELLAFHDRLCHVRVLDPACGSGNFLYVTLEHLKRLEGEVFNALDELGHSQARLELAGATVDPHQMLGLETNPRAARIAEAVIWIGYLQWHFRTRGDVQPPVPVLKDFHNIECRDAVLAWDDIEYEKDDQGRLVTRWDGRTTKTHPVTGEEVPDEAAQIPIERYLKPHKATWPEADFVVGNPPFIGTGRMRQGLGDGYAEALRATYPRVPESADYVMYWWHHAADLARAGEIERFGLITTNSLRQTFNRRVVQHHLEQKKPLSLVFAIPDHPWVDSTDGAAVRIAMTVGEKGNRGGTLGRVDSEERGHEEGRAITLATKTGRIHADLKIGADVAACRPSVATSDMSNPGVKLHGSGFIVSLAEANALGLGRIPGIERHIRKYRNGRDLTQVSRDAMVIDLYGLSKEDVRAKYPEVFQWVFERVKPERDHNKREVRRRNWWLFGETNPKLRRQLDGLPRYIATVETSKHRFFVFLDSSVLPDNMLVNIATDAASLLGVLSSRVHVAWALAVGGRLGVGNDPRYNKTRCFETFPFPDPSNTLVKRIDDLAEQLDAHRKRQQELHPRLTLTGIYNVVEKLRSGEELTAKDKKTHEEGLVAVLSQLHDELDEAVFEAYGWADLAPALVGKPGGTTPSQHKSPEQEAAEEELLTRLVALNVERTDEEAQGKIRWLRPEFQNPDGAHAKQDSIEGVAIPDKKPTAVAGAKRPWPKGLADQVQAVRTALAELPASTSAEQLARTFKRAPTGRVAEILETLTALGQASGGDEGTFSAL